MKDDENKIKAVLYGAVDDTTQRAHDEHMKEKVLAFLHAGSNRLQVRVAELEVRVAELEEENTELMRELNRFYRVTHQGVEGQ